MQLSGGTATIHGVLFQILGSMKWACELALDAQLNEDGELDSAQLILEPIGGGDLLVERPTGRVVEQWKSRRSDRAWTLREIVTDVLPDLYSAVDPQRLGLPTSYRFRAEGTITDCSAAFTFFRKLSSLESSDFTLDDLDDSTAVRFLGGADSCFTERRLFEWIAFQLQQSLDRRAISISHDRLCHLLANFQVPEPQSLGDLQADIDSILRKDWVDHSEDVVETRLKLCGAILDLARRSSRAVDPAALLQSVGLKAIPFSGAGRICRLMSVDAEDSARRWFNYRRELDVRDKAGWLSNADVLILTGGSGSGKSWQLSSLIPETNSLPGCIFIRSQGSAVSDLSQVASVAWHKGTLRERTPVPFDVFCDRLRDANPELQLPWLNVLIDDVRSSKEIQHLCELPWAKWGVRLAISAPTDLGGWSRKKQFSNTSVVEVGYFDVRQVREFLRRNNRDWTGIPPDVREHLQRPLLAEIYCRINPHSTWRPESEYDLFSEVWGLIRSHHEQAEHPDDQPRFRQLVESLLDESPEYPWTINACNQAGLDSPAITRLERLGWLTRDDGKISVWHNRLLCWAVAEALSDRLKRSGPSAVPDVCRLLREVVGNRERPVGQHLGYVHMDLLWLVTAPNHPARSHAHELLRAAEDAMYPNGRPDNMYKSIIPTLGSQIVEGLRLRSRIAAKDGDHFIQHLVTKSLNRIGGSVVSEAAISLLREPDDRSRVAGMEVLTRWPAAEALDQLWAVYQECRPKVDESDEKQNRRCDIEYPCENALRECLPLDLEWLRSTIQRDGHDRRSASLLAYVLSRVDVTRADEIWRENRETLITALNDGSHPLALCVRRFRDHDCIGLMDEWATSGDPRKMRPGFTALCHIAPDKALSAMERIPSEQLGWRPDWFDVLHLKFPSETQVALHQIISRSPRDAAYASQVYLHRSHRIDSETLCTLFHALNELLKLTAADELKGDLALHRLLDLLGRTSTVPQLAQFRSLRGTELENRLAAAACEWLSDDHVDQDLANRHVSRVLLRIGGDGLSQFANAQMRHINKFTRLKGIKNACIRPDEETIRLLTSISQSDEPYDSAKPQSHLLQSEAIEALAAIGADEAFVAGMLKWGGDVNTLRAVRDYRAPLVDGVLVPVFSALKSESIHLRKNALLTIAVSGRKDLIPLVRSILAGAESDALTFEALWALYGLGAADDDSVASFAAGLSDEKLRYASVLGLLRSERSDARQRLVHELSHSYPDLPGGTDALIPLALSDFNETRRTVAEFVWQSDQEPHSFRTMFRDLRLIELLGDIDDPGVIEYLLQEVEPPSAHFRVTGRQRAAIRALSKHDPDAAFEAASAALISGPHDRHLFPQALVEIDSVRAIPVLCQQLIVEKSAAVRRSICVALRHNADREQLCRELRSLMDTGSSDGRFASAQIASWHVDESLTDLKAAAESECLEYVQRSFLHAVYRQERELCARSVLEQLRSNTDPVEQWCLVDALFELVEPECVGYKSDPLWIAPINDRLPPILQNHVAERYEQQMKEVEKSLHTQHCDLDD